MLRLIVEDDNETFRASVVESTEEEKAKDIYHPLILRGVYARAGVLNRNKRKYDFPSLKKEFDKFIEEDVKTGRAFGDFEHPKDSEIKRERAAVKIDKIECDEKNQCWYGESRVMYTDEKHGVKGTPRGDLAKSYFDYGSEMGFSTRGCGEIVGENVTNYKLITIDMVLDPSIGEFCEGILESKAFMIDTHGQIVECAMNEYENAINSSARTYDLNRKREIMKAAWDTLLKKV